jgi:hypothetical protein
MDRRGIWYIYSKEDLYEIYKVFRDFYYDVLKPLYGPSNYCDFEYDSDLCVVKIRNYGNGDKFSKKARIISLSKYDYGVSDRIQLLLNSLVSVGICNVSFSKIKVGFNTTSIDCVGDINSCSLLVTKGKSASFKLVGNIL